MALVFATIPSKNKSKQRFLTPFFSFSSSYLASFHPQMVEIATGNERFLNYPLCPSIGESNRCFNPMHYDLLNVVLTPMIVIIRPPPTKPASTERRDCCVHNASLATIELDTHAQHVLKQKLAFVLRLYQLFFSLLWYCYGTFVFKLEICIVNILPPGKTLQLPSKFWFRFNKSIQVYHQ